ncbi:hypothetical protein [Stieleria mannarensis]|uniref:hypothetical protein n=1 Tax=Stieleria mannarensis TaxID=2755585 RepID=UPI0016036686|nr:hypothetical protein [Rhodopirellula sp. JC639]
MNLPSGGGNQLGKWSRIINLGLYCFAPDALPDRPCFMHPSAADSILATVTPVPEPYAGRVLTIGWKLMLNASLLLAPVLMVGLVSPLFLLSAWVGSGVALLPAAVLVPLIIVGQISWAGTYPEWPMNQWLVRRLRRSLRMRPQGGLDPETRDHDWIQTARLVEWVPRENWNATMLDTAEDVMLIHIDEAGVAMEGDHSRYWFPAASIIDVGVESVRPTGCFHRLHFVVVTVRTADGPLEFALAYRDHRLGGLRSRHRRQQTIQLCNDIGRIATGGDFSYRDPGGEHRQRLDLGHVGVGKPGAQSPRPQLNPYAAPRSV